MEKNIKDYLHLYLNEDNPINAVVSMITEPHLQRTIQLTGWNYYANDKEIYSIKPILRPFSDMTHEEKRIRDNLMTKGTDGVHSVIILMPNVSSFKYLLDKHFDLFGLIESGLAIDKTKLQSK